MAAVRQSLAGATDTANTQEPSPDAATAETAEKKAAPEEPKQEIEPHKLTRGQRFRKFLHNSETGEYMGRTCLSWGRIFVYYLIFYAFLCTLFCGLLIAFLHTLSESEPYFQMDDSIIGSSPGLSFFPTPYTSDSGKDSDLIWFTSGTGRDANWNYYEGAIDKRLEAYETATDIVTCSPTSPATAATACDFDVSTESSSMLGGCKDAPYGYDTGTPCIFLSLNRIYGWEPKTYGAASELPKGAPSTLNGAFGTESLVLVECNGENAEDQMNLGSVTYFPKQGFPTYYFPYKNQKHYLNPLVAVKFNGILKDTLVNIRCNAWAKNIKQDAKKRIGSLKLSIIIDSPKP